MTGSPFTVESDTAIDAVATGDLVRVYDVSGKDYNSVKMAQMCDMVLGQGATASIGTAGAGTYSAANLLTGLIVRDPAGASRTDTCATAADLVAAIPGAFVGQRIYCKIVNGADAAETITVDAGTGGTYDANQTAASRVIGQNTGKTLVIRLTNVTAASEAYVLYV